MDDQRLAIIGRDQHRAEDAIPDLRPGDELHPPRSPQHRGRSIVRARHDTPAAHGEQTGSPARQQEVQPWPGRHHRGLPPLELSTQQLVEERATSRDSRHGLSDIPASSAAFATASLRVPRESTSPFNACSPQDSTVGNSSQLRLVEAPPRWPRSSRRARTDHRRSGPFSRSRSACVISASARGCP